MVELIDTLHSASNLAVADLGMLHQSYLGFVRLSAGAAFNGRLAQAVPGCPGPQPPAPLGTGR